MAAERSGFDSLWLADRITGLPDAEPPGDQAYEAYSLLGALAVVTRTIRLGAFSLGGDTRAPSVLAKIVTAIDVISHGRGVVVLGTRTGTSSDSSDLERLAEGLQVCRAMLDDEIPTFEGIFYAIDGAVNRPHPVQLGGIPLIVKVDNADGRREEVLGIAARFADGVVIDGDPASVDEAVRVVKRAAQTHGRNPASIQVIWSGSVVLDEVSVTPGAARPSASPASSGRSISGGVTQIVSEVRRQMVAGADGCIVSVSGPDAVQTIEALGPALRAMVDSDPARPGSYERRA